MSITEAEAVGRRILVVDDHPASRYGTVRVLRSAGFTTLEADSGAQALERARERPDLIVLDVNLPDMDGFEVCRRLRARPESAHVPVIYLTATFTHSADKAHGLLAGADSYLTHPAEPVVLIATVRALLFAGDADAIRRRTDARFRTIFESTSGGIAILDPQLTFSDVNAAFCELTGRSRSELLQAPMSAIIAPEFASTLAGINTELSGTGHWEGLVPLLGVDGTPGLSEWRFVVEAETGVRIAIVTDVTERIRAEGERERLLLSERAARAEADRSNQLKDEFLAMLSHELRNPLAAILGWATLLRRIPDLPPLVRQGVEAIERNSKVQSHLTSDLLDYAGIQFGKMRLETAVIDPVAVVDAATEIVAPLARDKQIRLVVDARAGECSVVGDATRLQQVVWNLLTNAVKFTPTGGTITVATQCADGWFQVDVTDTGKGISAEFLPRLFDRFSQQDTGSTKSFSGLGIGLTIVRHLLLQHHGTIEVSSPGEGLGATFRVRLPLTQQPRRATTEAASASLADLDVLVVEDFDDARALIVRLLSEAGAHVREAAGGHHALQEIQASKPDVLISDIGMARMDGYELIRSLRAGGYSAQLLPAIALTAFVRSEERSAALEAGFQLHLGKPVNAQSLIEAVAQVYAQSRTAAPA
jgi:PAS domain S-box-containing protein